MAVDAVTELKDGEALYLYAVVRSAEPMRLDVPGIDAARPLMALHHAGLTAIVSAVLLTAFRGPQGEQNLADLGWLGPRALAHEAVIERLMAQCTVFPLPLGTLFSSRQALREALDARREQIESALERLRGCREWAVQGHLDREAALDARMDEAIASGRYVPAVSLGRQHLEKQRLRRELARDLDAWLLMRTAPLAETLRRQCAGFCERQLQADQGWVFNWAVLVRQQETAHFHQILDEARAVQAVRGLRLACKGPFAPYSFCGKAP
ncbi:hypothetical protein CKO42_15295 [Lamprobacter modestohalophilus]|uniref:Gas vesicle protein GvpFL n=1 Tax=Lamprobacter modestohalophilus TaxID=1064514 RepID=A0A9X1B4S7_9GAMM|nr:GvpL/GvpF family gas vesicle protein [Lamprobacter modestohalophilus]MBK1619783.1 hypothetical protein [Lamprobacter modestohalophilus]